MEISDVSGKPVRFVYNFRYLNDSYVYFVVKKEQLLLDLDHAIPEPILLNLIVLSLPTRIHDSLNRSSVTTIKVLIQKLKKFDGESTKRANSLVRAGNKYTGSTVLEKSDISERSKKVLLSGKTLTEKRPCFICEKKR